MLQSVEEGIYLSFGASRPFLSIENSNQPEGGDRSLPEGDLSRDDARPASNEVYLETYRYEANERPSFRSDIAFLRATIGDPT